MKKKHNLIVFVIVLALIAGLLYMQESSRVAEVPPVAIDVVSATVAGVNLAYPARYGVYEKTNSPVTKTLTTVVWYEDTESNRGFFTGSPTAPGEPPVTMSLDVYNNPNNVSAKEVLSASPYMFAKGDGTPVVIAGVEGVVLEWDGLYKGMSVAVNSKGLLYVFSVTSITPTDAILRDFELLMNSIVFK